MAVLMTKATGNFTSGSTWTTTSTATAAFLDSEAGTTAVTAANQDSATFTPGTEIWEGIALKISTMSTAPTGTMSVTLRNSTLGIDVTTVTINNSDLPFIAGTSAVPSWVFFKFSAAITLAAATNYVVRCISSSSSQVVLFTNGTAANWSRFARIQSMASPAASDQLLILGEYTGAGTSNTLTVTMDSTATTSYGSTTPTDSIHIGGKGVMTFGTTASTAYKLQYKGRFRVGAGGTLNIGTSGTRMPSTSTAELIMDSTANVDTGLYIENNATFNAYGNRKNNFWSLLTVDLAAAGTTSTITSTTDWVTNDEVGYASTSRTSTQFEKRTITSVMTGTQFTHSAITNAHSGTSPTQGEAINLTRNVKIYGISTSLQGYIYSNSYAVATLDSIETYNLGSGTSGKRGIDVLPIGGSFNMQYCSIHDFIVASSVGLNAGGGSLNNLTFSNNVIYNIATNGTSINNAASGTYTFANNVVVGILASTGMNFADAGGTITGNRVTGGGGTGLAITEGGGTVVLCSDNVSHSNTGFGYSFSNIKNCLITNSTVWRNAGGGISFSGAGNTYNTGTLFGNATDSLQVGTGCGNILFKDFVLNGDTSFASTNGFRIATTSGYAPIRFENCDFSTVSGIKTAHSSDLNISATIAAKVILNNTKLGASVEVTTASNMDQYSIISSQNHDQTANSHKYWQQSAIGTSDTTITDGGGYSERLTPSSATLKCFSSPKQAAVAASSTLTVSVKVRCSVVGDGTAYNGARPRLIVRANPALGTNFNSDTVLATATGASDGAFQTLSVTTASATNQGVMEFYVDGDGTTGFFSIDTFSVS